MVAAAWALRPAAEYALRPRTEILLDQLAGRGCQFQDPLTGVHSFSPLTERTIRHPAYACPLWAAAHLAALPHPPPERARIAAAIEAAIPRHPAVFDTGDGLLHWAGPLRAARAAVLSASSPPTC